MWHGTTLAINQANQLAEDPRWMLIDWTDFAAAVDELVDLEIDQISTVEMKIDSSRLDLDDVDVGQRLETHDITQTVGSPDPLVVPSFCLFRLLTLSAVAQRKSKKRPKNPLSFSRVYDALSTI